MHFTQGTRILLRYKRLAAFCMYISRNSIIIPRNVQENEVNFIRQQTFPQFLQFSRELNKNDPTRQYYC
jgi:hypothetical protein